MSYDPYIVLIHSYSKWVCFQLSLEMGGCFWFDDHPTPEKLELAPNIICLQRIHFVWPYKESQRWYCMHVAAHNIVTPLIFFELQCYSKFWCYRCLQTSNWLILMGSHMHLTSLTRQQETLPSGPALRMLNRDNQNEQVSHKSSSFL